MKWNVFLSDGEVELVEAESFTWEDNNEVRFYSGSWPRRLVAAFHRNSVIRVVPAD